MADDLKVRIDLAADVSGKDQVDGLVKSVDRLGDQARQAFGEVAASERAAQGATDQLAAAFARLGVRSAEAIAADLLAVNQSLQQLARSSKVSGADFDRAFAAGQARLRQLRAELDGASGAVAAVGQRADALSGLLGRLGGAFTGLALAREFLTVNVQLEQMERTFAAIGGSSEAAAQEMAYVRDVANRLSLPLLAAGQAYADLMAATKGTAVEGQATRTVFEAVARAMSVAGKSADDTQGALLALAQMASKGVVSMEELRGQLGERLPGALQATASGLGITSAQLIKLVESGRLTTEQLFPALAQGLADLYQAAGAGGASAQTLAQKWDAFRNSVADAFKTMGDAGVIDVLKGALDGLQTALVVTSVFLVALGKNLGIFFAALKQGDLGFSGFKEGASEAFAAVGQKVFLRDGQIEGDAPDLPLVQIVI